MLLYTLSREYQLTDFRRRCVCLMQRRFPKGNVTLCLKEMMVGIAENTSWKREQHQSLPELTTQPACLPTLHHPGKTCIGETQHQHGWSLPQCERISVEELLHFIYICPLHLVFFSCSSNCLLYCLNWAGKGNFGCYLKREFNLTQAGLSKWNFVWNWLLVLFPVNFNLSPITYY